MRPFDPNPPQGDTYYCWAASVVCAAHDLGYDVDRHRSAAGVERLVRAYGWRVGQRAGIVHVVALAARLGVRAGARKLDSASARTLVIEGHRVIVNWNPAETDATWFNGQHMGAVLSWNEQVVVSDSFGANGERAALRCFTPPRERWFLPKAAVLYRP